MKCVAAFLARLIIWLNQRRRPGTLATPPSKDKYVKLSKFSQFVIGVNVSVCGVFVSISAL